MGLTSPFRTGTGKTKKIVFPLCGTGITKKLSRYLGRERESTKSFPAIRDGNGKPKKVFPLCGNGNSRRSHWEIYGNRNFRSCLTSCATMGKYLGPREAPGVQMLPLGNIKWKFNRLAPKVRIASNSAPV